MIALTQEKREELAKFVKATLNSLNGIEPENPNQYDDCLSEYTQKCMEIALASLTATPTGSFHIYAQKVDATTDYIREGEWPIDEGELLVYTAPPVPEINIPHELMDLVNAVDFYNAVKAENPATETGMWRDAYDWIKKAAVEAAPVIKRLNGLGE